MGIGILLSISVFILYVCMQSLSIYAGDSGELVAAAYTWSIAHPPGYPLYVLLGNIISHTLPVFTVAWRVGLLSSVFSAAAVFFLWRIIREITKSDIAAVSGGLVWATLYPVWLYAIVPEVFGLFAFFSAVMIYVFLRYQHTGSTRYLYILALLSGLSLTHHHVVVLFIGSIVLWLGIFGRDVLRRSAVSVWKAGVAFLVGFSVYLYAPIASWFYPPLDWEHPASPVGFFRLVTRAAYGTFRATYSEGPAIMDRWLNLLTFFQYVLKDFGYIGILLALIGFVFLRRRHPKTAQWLSLYFGLQLFYFFYAGFSLTSDFAVGTLERFFIVPYLTVCVYLAVGLGGLLNLSAAYWKKYRTRIHIPYSMIRILMVAAVLLIPISAIRHNYPNLSLIRNDRTLENLADDILASTPQNGILNLTDDTSIFAVMHALFVEKKRPDIRFIIFARLQFPDYPAWIKRHYRDVAIPQTPIAVSYREYLKTLLDSNAPLHPIVTERAEPSVPQYWVPAGLLMMYYPDIGSIPDRGQILSRNEQLWKGFQDPLDGILGTYRHLMMSDVLRYYSGKRIVIAQAYALHGNMEAASANIAASLRWTPDSFELFAPYIETLMDLHKCREPVDLLLSVRNRFVNEYIYLSYFHKLYEACPDERERLMPFEQSYAEYTRKHGEKIQ